MGKQQLSERTIQKIQSLRKNGLSMNEIRNICPYGKATIFKYIKDVNISLENQKLIRSKQGGSKRKADKEWKIAEKRAAELIGKINFSNIMIAFTCLHWGEGNKRELNLINGDPDLIRAYVECLRALGVNNHTLKVSLRLYEDINIKDAVQFWSEKLNYPSRQITSIDILKGKEVGKLKFGMCRIRAEKGKDYFKLVMSMIDLLKAYFSRCSLMDRTKVS